MQWLPSLKYDRGITRTKLSAEFSRPKLTEMSYSAKLSSDAKKSEETADFCIGIDRRQRTEDRRQRTEDRRQRTEDRGQMTDDRRQRTEDRHLTSVI